MIFLQQQINLKESRDLNRNLKKCLRQLDSSHCDRYSYDALPIDLLVEQNGNSLVARKNAVVQDVK